MTNLDCNFLIISISHLHKIQNKLINIKKSNKMC